MTRVASTRFWRAVSFTALRRTSWRMDFIFLILLESAAKTIFKIVRSKKKWRKRWSANAIRKRRLDRFARLQSPENCDRLDSRTGEFGRDIIGDDGKAHDLDSEHFARSFHRFEVFPAVVPQTNFESLPHDGLFDGLRMMRELIANRRPNHVGAVGVEAFAHKKIDMAKVDITEVNRDLFALAHSVAHAMKFRAHVFLHPYGWYMDGMMLVCKCENGVLSAKPLGS